MKVRQNCQIQIHCFISTKNIWNGKHHRSLPEIEAFFAEFLRPKAFAVFSQLLDFKSLLSWSTPLLMQSFPAQQALHNYVNTATATVDLFELLRFVNLDDLKIFAHEQVTKLNEPASRIAYHSVLPITNVLPNDMMQHILSFGSFHEKIENRIICKQWNLLYKLNEENMLRTAYRSVNDKYPNPVAPCNDTWVWHQVRKKLHPLEKRLGYKGPVYGLKDVEKYCKSGDRVLIHRDVFEEDGDEKNIYFSKDIYCIGLFPEKLEPKLRCRIGVETLTLFGHLTLDNLRLTIHSSDVLSDECFGIGKDENLTAVGARKLTLRHCDVQIGNKIKVNNLGSLDMQQCTVKCQLKPDTPTIISDLLAVEISPWANQVDIRNNTFKGFKRAIAIQRHYPFRHSIPDNPDDLAENINIEDNVFEDIAEYAVVERTDFRRNQSVKIKGTDRYRLRGNIGASEIPNPNVLHHVEGDFRSYLSDYE